MSKRNMLQNAEFSDLVHDMDNADGVFITCTLKTGDMLEHRIITEDFPKADILSSLTNIEEKCIYDLKHPPREKPPVDDEADKTKAIPVQVRPVQVKPVKRVKRSGG